MENKPERRTGYHLHMFEVRLDTLLQCVHVPNVWLYLHDDFSNTESVQADIDKLTADIGNCLHSAVNEVIPMRTRSYTERNMPVGIRMYVRSTMRHGVHILIGWQLAILDMDTILNL